MKLKVYIHAEYNAYDKEFEFKAWPVDMRKTPALGQQVGTHEFEFDAPSRETLVNGTIGALREKQQKIRADAEMESLDVERQISELLCIEYKPEEPT